MTPLRIYLADLTHVGKGIATEAFPLNVGLVASYAKKLYGNEIDVRLYKLPGDLKEAIAQQPPHILACSNYTWNCNLSYYFCGLAKSINKETITVFGGTNYPFTENEQMRFLSGHPAVDLHIFYEGEQAFANVVERVLSAGHFRDLGSEPIPGCQFIERGSGRFVNGGPLPRIKDLDKIPSPYVTGLLDKFFNGQFTPLVETARGCPFLCNFCNAGDRYFTKVNVFSDDYVREELTYIARRAREAGVTHVSFADNNFGMIPRDAATAQIICDLQESYGWPRSITAWTGKNSKERVIEVTRLLGETLSISMSVQSMDDGVLKNIGRDNIKLDHYRKIAQELKNQGRPQHAEVIIPLPGETLESHIRGLNDLLDTGVSRVLSHTLQMLYGTPYKDDAKYRMQYSFMSRFRLVPMDFTKIDENYIFDVEEVAVASNTLSFEDYLQSRRYLLVIDLCHNSEIFRPLQKYLGSRGVPNSAWIEWIYQHIGGSSEKVDRVFESFMRETISELWETEEELVEFYSRAENYEKVVNYEAGGNVLFKHRVWMLSAVSREWIELVFDSTSLLLNENSRELTNIKNYVSCSSLDCFSPDSLDETIVQHFDFDIPAWLEAPAETRLSEFALHPPVPLNFSFSDRARSVTQDGFRRYGTELSGLIKLIQRISGISFKRSVHAMQGPGRSSL